jgi:hypothetical protein
MLSIQNDSEAKLMTTDLLPTVISRPKRSRFSSSLFVRCPASLPDALALAADKEMTTVSDYIRTAVLSQLRRDGIDLPIASCENDSF